nr:MAG TPA: hypothetical protein [Caudoviricetes sp.]
MRNAICFFNITQCFYFVNSTMQLFFCFLVF